MSSNKHQVGADVSGPCPAVIGRLSQLFTIHFHLYTPCTPKNQTIYTKQNAASIITDYSTTPPGPPRKLPHHKIRTLKTRCRSSTRSTNLVTRHFTPFLLFYFSNTDNHLCSTTPPPPPLRPPTSKRLFRRTKNALLITVPPPLCRRDPQSRYYKYYSVTKSSRRDQCWEKAARDRLERAGRGV